MTAFLTPLRVELAVPWANDGTGDWDLLEAFRFYSDLLGEEIEIPARFRFDGSSVPKLPIAFALYGGRYWRAALVHDYLIASQRVPRAIADRVFLELMRHENELELEALRQEDADEEEIAERAAALEGRAWTMFAAVSVYTRTRPEESWGNLGAN